MKCRIIWSLQTVSILLTSRKFHRRFLLILIALTAGTTLLFSFVQPKDMADAETAQLATKTAIASLPLHKRVKGQHIFFLETSGRPCLTARQACGVESAARANPNATITLYVEKTPVKDVPVSDRGPNCVITSLLQQMKNVKILREELLENLKDTPLWKLYQKGLFNKSTSPLVHRSDAVRVALLWKKGGLYLDLDVIVFRPLDSLNNTVGKTNDFIDNWVENGVMAFEAGHLFLKYLMKAMVKSFNPKFYLSIGPQTLQYALQDFCDRDDLPANRWLSCWHNTSLIIQSPEAFYAISNAKRERFYQPEADPADFHQLRTSFLSHIYDSTHVKTVPTGSLFAKLAQKYCPISYELATKEENNF